MVDTSEALALVGGLAIGLLIGWLIWLLNAPSRRRFDAMRRELDVTRQRLASQEEPRADVIDLADRKDRDRLLAERDAAMAERDQTQADRDRAEADADAAAERARVAEARLDASHAAIRQIRSQLELAATTPIRPAIIDLRDDDGNGNGPVVTVSGLPAVGRDHEGATAPAARSQRPVAPTNEFDRVELVEQIAVLQEHVVGLRRQVAAGAIDADRLRVDLARRRAVDRELIATLDRLRGLRDRLDQLSS